MEIKLINSVKKYPQLFDHANVDFKSHEVRTTVWNEIALEVFKNSAPSTISAVKQKWKYVRDGYVKYHKKITEGKKRRIYKYENELSFLLPHLKNYQGDTSQISNFYSVPTPTLSNRQSPKTELEVNYQTTDDHEMSYAKADEWTTNEGDYAERVEESSGKEYQTGNAKKRHIVFIPDSDIENPTGINTVDSYFSAMATTVKRFKPERIIDLKKKISQLVFDAELDELRESESISSSC